MNLSEVLLLAVGLSMDAFAVAVATSTALERASRRQVFRLSFHFGFFQAFMPVVGWIVGRSIAHWIVAWDHWVAFGLLAYIGGKAIHEALSGKDEARPASDPTRGANLVLLSVATSIDALAVGLSFAMLQVAIWVPVLIIGLVTGGLTVIGMMVGGRIGLRFGRRMEIVGGLVLIGIGLKILFDHMGS